MIVLKSFMSIVDRTFYENRVDLSAGEDACLPHFCSISGYDDRHLIAGYDFSDPIIFRTSLEEVFSIRQIDAFFIDDTMDDGG